jgi:hypothetical protein
MAARNRRACAPRARDARLVLNAALFIIVLAFTLASATVKARNAAKQSADAGDFTSVVGTWQATAPGGVRVGTLTIVQNGDGLGGAFVGYDYSKPLDLSKPTNAPPPNVALRSSALLSDVKLDAGTLTFKMYLRHPSPPPGKPAGFELSGELKLQSVDEAELRLSASHKPEPMVLKLTRE